jgi:hypothetical protein
MMARPPKDGIKNKNTNTLNFEPVPEYRLVRYTREIMTDKGKWQIITQKVDYEQTELYGNNCKVCFCGHKKSLHHGHGHKWTYCFDCDCQMFRLLIDNYSTSSRK